MYDTDMTSTTITLTPKMLARRARGGYTIEDTRATFNELVSKHTGDNLAHALAYNYFTPSR